MTNALKLSVMVTVLLSLLSGSARAQEPVELERYEWATHSLLLRVGQDYTLRDGESVRDLIVVGGTATINGTVRGDITVVFGTLALGPTAVVNGSLVVVAGTARVTQGAAVRQNLLVVGGGLEGPPDFTPGRDHLVVGSAAILERGRAFVPWLTQGLLMARPIVPQLRWVWVVVLIVFVVSLLLDLVFADAVRLCVQSLVNRPLSTFLVGLLVLLLTGPAAVILAASVIGLAVVPFLLAALVIAWTLGKVGVAVWVGGSVTGQRVPETRPQSLIAFAIGFVAICIVYMVPVLGFVAWGVVGVVGLGAATLAFFTAYRRENPVTPKPPPASREPVVPPPPASADAGPFEPPQPSSTSAAYATASTPYIAPGDWAVPSGASAAAAAAASPAALLQFPRAAFLDRACAFALDAALVMITNEWLRLNADGSAVLLLIAYHIGFWMWKATTIGGIICQLRVVRITGEPLRFVDALVRGLSSIFSLAVFGLGALWILRDPERQAWHDKIAGTYVVKVPRHYPLP